MTVGVGGACENKPAGTKTIIPPQLVPACYWVPLSSQIASSGVFIIDKAFIRCLLLCVKVGARTLWEINGRAGHSDGCWPSAQFELSHLLLCSCHLEI